MFDRGDKIIYMKVGTHAQESLADIIERKRGEIAQAGFALWGYGGSTCHPQRVQPFASAAGNDRPIILAMQEMESKHFAEPVRAEEYSVDGISYRTIPPEINVLGSRYALFLKSLEQIDSIVDLSRTRVALGNSAGKSGNDYIRGHVDKACLELVDEPHGEPREVKIGLSAQLMDPYAVFLRNS